MKCVYCSGKMKKGSTTLHIDREGCHVTIDKTPAFICEQCGEAYFEEKEVDTIQELVKSIEQKAHKLALSA